VQFPSFVVRDSLNRPRHPRHTGCYVASRAVRGVEGEVVLGVAAVRTIEGEALRLVVLDGPGDSREEQAAEAA
jgi:hypothetical protein